MEHEASRRLKTELLIQMDGLCCSDIFVMVASNNPWDLDSSFLRRIEKRVILLDFCGPSFFGGKGLYFGEVFCV